MTEEKKRMAGGSRGLQVGQTVRVEDLDGKFRLVVLAPSQQGRVVLTAEPEYVLLADGDETMRIPTYLIQEVVAPAEDKPEAA
jgi:hypothetical protein